MKKLFLSSLVFLSGYAATKPNSSLAPGVWKLEGTFEMDATMVIVTQGNFTNQDVDSQPGYNWTSYDAAGAILHTSKKWHPQFPEGSDNEQEIPANYQTLQDAIDAYNRAGFEDTPPEVPGP